MWGGRYIFQKTVFLDKVNVRKQRQEEDRSEHPVCKDSEAGVGGHGQVDAGETVLALSILRAEMWDNAELLKCSCEPSCP